jgi:uncharacterized protein YdbL (DUF1318 family)
MTISSRVRALARLVALVALVFVAVPGLASAQSLDALRADGTIGERYDGTVVVRGGSPSTAVLDFVASVNAQRQKIYADRAAQQGVPVGQVARIYAKEIYAKLPAGAWFLDESGTWRQK